MRHRPVVLQQALADLDAVYRNFFASAAGRPKAGRARPGDRGDPWLHHCLCRVSGAARSRRDPLAVFLLPSRYRLEEFRSAAAPALVPAPAPQPDKHAIPVAPVGCSPVITHVSGPAATPAR